MSRYYYVTFGCSRAYLIDTLNEIEYHSKVGIHGKVIKRFETSMFENEKDLSQPLDRLRDFSEQNRLS